jgi:hypothetical protein
MAYLANMLGDANNLGFFATPEDLTAAYPVGAPGYFAVVGSTNTLWVWDVGINMWVDSGAPGSDAFVYIAYASDDAGTDFTNTFDPLLDYIAIKSSTVAIPSPVAGDFIGLWKNYKGLHWMGTYGAGTSYKQGDAVAYLGTSYIYINTTPGAGHTPADDAFWDILALKGADGSGAGDVSGPASSVIDNFASYADTTGKLIKDSGKKASDFATAAQGSLADTALQNIAGEDLSTADNSVSQFITLGDIPAIALDDLSDVTIASPLVDQVLKYNGADWINGAQASASIGPGVTFFLDDTAILAPGAGPQTIPLYTLSKTPAATAEDTDTVQTNSAAPFPVLLERYLYNAGLGGTQIDAGVWTFNTYNFMDSVTGVSTMPKTLRAVTVGAGTVTITGVGTARTATVTGGTPFLAGDANANPTLAGLLRTPNALFQISAFVSSSVVTVVTLATYTNETGVAYSKDRFLFTVPGVEINNLTVALNVTQTTQPAFPIASTDKLELSYYATTTSAGLRTFSLVHGGNTNYSNFVTPLVSRHNDLAGLQGGTSGEYYHLTLTQINALHGVNDANTTSNSYADGKVIDSIADADTTHAPSRNAVFDALALKLSLAGGTTTGDITIGDAKQIKLIAPTADVTCTGFSTSAFNSGYTSSAIGDLVYLDASATWQKVDADAISTAGGMLGIALAVAASGSPLLVALPGSFVRVNAWTWTPGTTLYCSETPGGIATTIPTGADGVVRVIGWACNADYIYFYPSSDNSTVVA